MNSNNKTYRVIYHIDMNCFFASCHIAKDPSLKGKPIIIAHDEPSRKSIILTASYEARKYGIYTTMLTGDAIKKCPSVKIVEPNYELYSYYSKMFFDYLFTITNTIEIMSIDEGFLDVTDVVDDNDYVGLAKRIQNKLLNDYKLPCSIGIAPNKFLAKMASDMKKPLGITVLRKRDVQTLMWPLDIKEMFGVGKKSQPRLREIGVNTIGDILKIDYELLKKTVGDSFASYLVEKAKGNDDSPVVLRNDDEFSSVSNEHTFDYNVNSIETVKTMIKILANSVASRLEEHKFIASTIGVKIRYNDFVTITRSQSVKATNDNYAISKIAQELFDEYNDKSKSVRLIGVYANRLSKENEIKITRPTLFDDLDKVEQNNKVNKLLADINKEFKSDIINVGCGKIKGENNEIR